MGLFSSFDPNKAKVNLKLAQTRIKLLKNKKDQLIIQKKREVADLLRENRDEHARIRVEHVIREKLTLEAFELLEIFCDFLLARFTLIEKEKICPHDLREAVCTVIWASSRCDDIRELQEVTKQFRLKYGSEFVDHNMSHEENVHLRVVHRLNFSAPDPFVVIKQLSSIAKEFDIPWESDNVLEEPLIPDLLPQPLAPNYPPPNGPPGGGYGGGYGGGGGGAYAPMPPAYPPGNPYPASQPHYGGDFGFSAPAQSVAGGVGFPMMPHMPPPAPIQHQQQQPYAPYNAGPPPPYQTAGKLADTFEFPQPPSREDMLFPKPPDHGDMMFPKPPGFGGNNGGGGGGGTLIGADGSIVAAERPSFSGPAGGGFPMFPATGGASAPADNSNGRVPDFDELAARFEQLRNKTGN